MALHLDDHELSEPTVKRFSLQGWFVHEGNFYAGARTIMDALVRRFTIEPMGGQSLYSGLFFFDVLSATMQENSRHVLLLPKNRKTAVSQLYLGYLELNKKTGDWTCTAPLFSSR